MDYDFRDCKNREEDDSKEDNEDEEAMFFFIEGAGWLAPDPYSIIIIIFFVNHPLGKGFSWTNGT